MDPGNYNPRIASTLKRTIKRTGHDRHDNGCTGASTWPPEMFYSWFGVGLTGFTGAAPGPVIYIKIKRPAAATHAGRSGSTTKPRES